MKATFLKLAIRNLLKRKGYAAVNIMGLSIGLVSFLLIMEFVIFEKSYDTFHKQSQRIYRVGFDWGEIDYSGINSSRYASNVPVMGPTMAQELPEVENYTRFFRVLTIRPFSVFTYRQNNEILYSGNEDEGFYADANFLKVFDFPIVSGDATPLSKPHFVAIT